MPSLVGNTLGNTVGNLLGEIDDGLRSGRILTRERRPIRRYTDWRRWSEVATEQGRLQDQLNLLARIASDMDEPIAAHMVKYQNTLEWVDVEFARRADQLDKAAAQVAQVARDVAYFTNIIDPPPPPPTTDEVAEAFRS